MERGKGVQEGILIQDPEGTRGPDGGRGKQGGGYDGGVCSGRDKLPFPFAITEDAGQRKTYLARKKGQRKRTRSCSGGRGNGKRKERTHRKKGEPPDYLLRITVGEVTEGVRFSHT